MATLTRKYVVCDECQREVEMSPDKTFSQVLLWNMPWKWFILKGDTNLGFCSWQCTRKYGDRTYGS